MVAVVDETVDAEGVEVAIDGEFQPLAALGDPGLEKREADIGGGAGEARDAELARRVEVRAIAVDLVRRPRSAASKRNAMSAITIARSTSGFSCQPLASIT